MPISALIVAHNEQEMIEDALKSLHFCDEIVVVLDRCTDDTKKIAAKFTKNIIEGSWEIEGERRAVGINACAHKWILECDADERVTAKLAQVIQNHVKTAPDGYVNLPVQNYVGDRLLQYGWAGSFGTTRAKKLFTKGAKVWGMQRVHPKIELKGEEQELAHHFAAGEGLTHLVDRDINDMIDRLQRYSDSMGADWRAQGYKPHFCTIIRKALTRFYKSFLARKGYKEGKMGFLLAIMAALLPILSYLKAHEEGKK